jgi:anti-anti-sigma factor
LPNPAQHSHGGPPARFGLNDTLRDGVRVVEVIGELDLATAPELEQVLAARPAGVRAVVVDLGAVAFIDSAGIRLLVGELRRCEQAELPFAVVPGDGEARRVLELSGLGTHLTLIEDARQIVG